MPLTQLQCLSTQPGTKVKKLFDGNGLFLEIKTNGAKKWRQKYRYDGKEKLLTHGPYPKVTLAQAREKREIALKQIKTGIDPSQAKKKEKLQQIANSRNDFQSLAKEWHCSNQIRWKSQYADKIQARLQAHVYPFLGQLPVHDITPPEVLAVIRRLEELGMTDLHTRVLQYINQVFIYGLATGKCSHNPASGLNKVVKPTVTRHYSFLKEDELPEFFQRLQNASCHQSLKIGLELIVLTAVRSGELRFATWNEVDLETNTWSIPAQRMKMKRPHIVPLSKQAKECFIRLRQINPYGSFVIPGRTHYLKPISENTLIYLLHRMGYHNKATVHGFRSTFSTILNEQGYRPDVIERQLAHIETNKVRAAYNHAEYLPERTQMMQDWADHLDQLREKETHKSETL